MAEVVEVEREKVMDLTRKLAKSKSSEAIVRGDFEREKKKVFNLKEQLAKFQEEGHDQ